MPPRIPHFSTVDGRRSRSERNEIKKYFKFKTINNKLWMRCFHEVNFPEIKAFTKYFHYDSMPVIFPPFEPHHTWTRESEMLRQWKSFTSWHNGASCCFIAALRLREQQKANKYGIFNRQLKEFHKRSRIKRGNWKEGGFGLRWKIRLGEHKK